MVNLLMRVEEWCFQSFGRSLWLAFRPWMEDGPTPLIAPSLRGLILNYLCAYSFGMFLLLFIISDDWWGRPFNEMDITIFQILKLVSICFAAFVALNVAALCTSALISWPVYRFLGSRAPLSSHVACFLDLTFLEFIAVESVISIPGVMGNRVDFWHNDWSYNVSVITFLATRAWYGVVAWFQLRSLHAPFKSRYRLSFVLGFCLVFLILSIGWVGWLWLRITEDVVMAYR